MWRRIGEITLLIAIGFILGLLVYKNFHTCPEPSSYSSYELRVYVPTKPDETKRLILHNKAQASILEQLEKWDREEKRVK